MVAHSSRPAGGGTGTGTGGSGKSSINTNSYDYEAPVQPIVVTANCANGSTNTGNNIINKATTVSSSNHRSQRGVVNCFPRFIFLRNMFILLVVVSSLLVSTTDAVISSRAGAEGGEDTDTGAWRTCALSKRRKSIFDFNFLHLPVDWWSDSDSVVFLLQMIYTDTAIQKPKDTPRRSQQSRELRPATILGGSTHLPCPGLHSLRSGET
uniref:Uncharacterized protein n=1 Tax=Anopheles farauti TaxID=69004 RepID=A0A182QEL3_9DIPT